MTRYNDDRDDDHHKSDSQHAELRGAYERGRRDQRRTRRSSPIMPLMLAGGVMAAAWLVLASINARAPMPLMATGETATAAAAEAKPALLNEAPDGWITTKP